MKGALKIWVVINTFLVVLEVEARAEVVQSATGTQVPELNKSSELKFSSVVEFRGNWSSRGGGHTNRM